MAKRLNISYDSDLIESISSEFDLRAPNKEALRKLIFTLDGDYDPEVIQVMNLATGVGKTYLMAAFMEYLRRQGVGNVVIVTPGKTVQAKTVKNFTPGSARYIEGAQVPPDVVTPQDYSPWIARQNGAAQLSFGRETPLLAFIFNIQQLIAPKKEEGGTSDGSQDAIRRKPRRFDENAGVLFDYLKSQDDLVLIADESHLYSASAAAFHSAIRELDPAATIGLTASVLEGDHVIYKYPLYRAIADEYVKTPVLAFRKGGYGEDEASEEQQLRDALQLRDIKQSAYDAYIAQNRLPGLNAVLFVVCSDVSHATEITNLLRGPEFFGRELAVLQVDSEHDDDLTQRMLEGLDDPNSPVKAVVSVNKLKEGWDVKNIAVVVTLRAMASEVLTQQTMGRGLRLPFGKYTGIRQVDQLDIISHQSFKELLEQENVLRQFGLEEAVSSDDRPRFEYEIAHIGQGDETTGTNSGSDSTNQCYQAGSNEPSPDTRTSFGTDTNTGNPPNKPTVLVQSVEDPSLTNEPDLTYVTIDPNPAFLGTSYDFPVTIIEAKQPEIDLSGIPDEALEAAARRITSTGDVLYRKEIVAVLGKSLRAVDTESAEVDSVHVSNEDAQDALIKLVLNMSMVPKTEGTARYIAQYLIPRFMSASSINTWTVKSLSSAQELLRQTIKDFIVETLRSTQEVPVIKAKAIECTGYSLPIGEKVYGQIDSRDEFVRGRVYSGWFKSLYAEESFDSYTGEYMLARLLNTSPHIVWWNRLHPFMDAFIYYTPKDRYFPDFVALDDEGTYWIIEGKDARGRDDEKVQAKRKAAEQLVRKLAIDDVFSSNHWGYLIAYEDDIAKSDSWNDLLALAQPVTNKI